MDAQTIQRLNAINQEFYRVTADEFDQTRGTAWPGWVRLLPHLRAPLSVLDVGCGNGRLGVFLSAEYSVLSTEAEKSDQSSAISQTNTLAIPDENGESETRHSVPSTQHFLDYHGVDSNAALLEHARAAMEKCDGVHFQLETRDIVENPPDAGEYDLVALLGVLHHIPGREERTTFLQKLAEHVKPGGLLVFAAWRFYEYERFKNRVVAWPDDIQVEANDYLLDWRRGVTALRYCHYVDDAEHDALVKATGLTEIGRYRADGESGATNCYSVLRR